MHGANWAPPCRDWNVFALLCIGLVKHRLKPALTDKPARARANASSTRRTYLVPGDRPNAIAGPMRTSIEGIPKNEILLQRAERRRKKVCCREA